MPLTREEVEKVALLARLKFSPEELDHFTEQLAQIVDYVAQLAELDTEGVPPMAHALDVNNVFRLDEPTPSLDREAALANAPKHDEQFYFVPPVLE